MQPEEIILRLILAILVGGIIGYERAFKNRPAGFRTHILVCVGAAIISIIQIETIERTKALILNYPILAQSLKADIGRMGAQVITGVGFLGAGTIIRERGIVKGLTTAASVWVVSCIGLAIGMGMYFISIMSSIGVFIALVILKKVEDKFLEQSYTLEIEVKNTTNKDFIERMQSYFENNHIKIKNIEFMLNKNKNGPESSRALYTVEVPSHKEHERIVEELCQYENVIIAKSI